jgi:C_GCAxxG_C_C family probable redox protein
MDHTELALDTFKNNFNCAQSVFSTFSEAYGLPRETALKLAGGLGGGVRCGEVCGAATGAVLVIGLKCGQTLPGDVQAKEYCNEQTAEFMRLFRERNGSCLCRDLLGIDISVGDNRRVAKEKNLFNTVCTDLITSAVEILEDMGY